MNQRREAIGYSLLFHWVLNGCQRAPSKDCSILLSRGRQVIADQLKRIYVEGLRILYNAENQLMKELPRMAKAATSEELSVRLTKRLEQAKEHVASLEKIFTAIKMSPRGERCTRTEHLIKEGLQMIGKHLLPEQLNGELITIMQSIESQEIAGYGWVGAHARFLKEDTGIFLLEKILEEVKVTAETWAQLSDRNIAMVTKVDPPDGGSDQWQKAAIANAGTARN